MVGDEVLDVITKMYAEMQKGFSRVDKRFEQIDKRFDKVDERIDKLENLLRIEHEHGEKLSALFDGYKQNSEKLDILDKKADKLQNDMENLTMKTAYHDKRILELAERVGQ